MSGVRSTPWTEPPTRSRKARRGKRRSATRARFGPATRSTSPDPCRPTTPVTSAAAIRTNGPRAPEIIDASLSEPDASLNDVVLTRPFVTNIENCEAVGRARAEAFGDARPAAMTVQVERPTDPESLVDKRATAKTA
jgi:hypothetical protein